MYLLQTSYCKCNFQKGWVPNSVINFYTLGLSGLKRTFATFQHGMLFMCLSVVKDKKRTCLTLSPALPRWKVEEEESVVFEFVSSIGFIFLIYLLCPCISLVFTKTC